MSCCNVIDQPPATATKRILVVEDDVFVAALVKELLRLEGLAVVGPAFSVAEALKLIDQQEAATSLSAAVLDYDLGNELVLPVADRLAALGIPFLFATAYGTACDRGQHAAAFVLEKPYGLGAFTNAVENLMTTRTSDQQDRLHQQDQMKLPQARSCLVHTHELVADSCSR